VVEGFHGWSNGITCCRRACPRPQAASRGGNERDFVAGQNHAARRSKQRQAVNREWKIGLCLVPEAGLVKEKNFAQRLETGRLVVQAISVHSALRDFPAI
jgi:hypothetical protein